MKPGGVAPELDAASTLSHAAGTRCMAPIPASERELPTATAIPWFQVSKGPAVLEGPAFDRTGNLLFVDIYGGRILRLSPDRKLTTVYTEEHLHPAGIAVHKDGRIFVAAVGPLNGDGYFEAGTVIALDAAGGNRQTIVPASARLVVDDLVFDAEGGIYLTDFSGTSTQPAGGVHYVAPDFQSVRPVLPNMAGANGVALSPDGKVLWATEFCACRLHRARLAAPGVIARFGSSIPYHFTGPGPDSMRTDSEGNVYVALNHQGRVLVFSPMGIPIGQILLPGREDNRFLKCTSLAIAPGSRELFIVARDDQGDGGAVIFRARGMADGLALFSHQ